MATQRVALITGCSSGVGLQTAILLAKQGFHVYASVRKLENAKGLAAVAESTGANLSILQLDVQEEASVKRAVSKLLEEAGRLDVLVNNAGFGALQALEQSSFGDIEEVMDVNFYGAVRCIRAVLPAMRMQRFGHIVSVSSVGGLVGQPLNEVYCAAKFALEGLIESMATYLEPYFNIKMTLIEPAGIQSDFVKRVAHDLQKKASPLQEVYAPIFEKYLESVQKSGAFEGSAQTSIQVAEVIAQCILAPTTALRVQTSDKARAFAAEKIQADPSGALLQKRIREEFLHVSL